MQLLYKAGIAAIAAGIPAVLLMWVTTFPALILYLRRKKHAAAIIEAAKAEGRCTQAREVKQVPFLFSWINNKLHLKFKSWYIYEVDGEPYLTYRPYKGALADPPKHIMVYWQKHKPGKAYTEDLDVSCHQYIRWMWVPVWVFLALFVLLMLGPWIDDFEATVTRMWMERY